MTDELRLPRARRELARLCGPGTPAGWTIAVAEAGNAAYNAELDRRKAFGLPAPYYHANKAKRAAQDAKIAELAR